MTDAQRLRLVERVCFVVVLASLFRTPEQLHVSPRPTHPTP